MKIFYPFFFYLTQSNNLNGIFFVLEGFRQRYKVSIMPRYCSKSHFKIFLSLFLGILYLHPFTVSGQSQGTIQGKITKRKNQDPLEYVNIILKKKGESGNLSGTTTNGKGRFKLQNVDFGTYKIALSHVGFQDKAIKGLTLSSENPRINLDTLTMQESPKNLDAVTFEEERDFLTQTPEGITVNPDKNITQTGGSALDILKNTPTVNVTFDGAVKMRGSEAGAIQILINGRQSALSNNLNQIPASAIESIEVIHNPGAKYRAEGKGGVINIVLKKPNKKGTNGKVQLSAGRDNRYNTSLQLNHGTDNFNHFLNFNRRNSRDFQDFLSEREVLNEENPNKAFIQEGQENEKEITNTIRGGTQYYWNFFNELGIDLLYENEDSDNRSVMENRKRETGESLAEPNLLSQKKQITETTESGYTLEPTIYYKRKFAEQKQSFKTSLKYSYDLQDEEQMTEKRPLLNPNGNPFAIRENNQITKETRHLGIFRADYTDPVFDSGKIEAGIRGQVRQLNSDYDYLTFDRKNTEWNNLDYISNDFTYDEQIYAAYFQYTHQWNDWTFMGGIRAEQTFIETALAQADSQSSKAYLNFFPSGRIQYQFNKDHSLTLSYTKRIDRPSAWRLNPFPDLRDSISIFVGNPDIDPEYIHSLELTHNKKWETVNLSSTVFYRKRNGVVDYLTQIRGGIPYIRPQNLASGETYGFELNSNFQLTKSWNLNINGSIYKSRLEGKIDEDLFEGSEAAGKSISNEAITWRSKMSTTFKLPWDIKLQLTANYNGPEVEALEREKPQYYFNAGLQKPIFDGKGNIGVNVKDFLDTRRMKEIGGTENFNELRLRERQSRVFMVSFDYEI